MSGTTGAAEEWAACFTSAYTASIHCTHTLRTHSRLIWVCGGAGLAAEAGAAAAKRNAT